MSIGSPDTPAPHSAPLRATQVLAKERGDRGNPKTDKENIELLQLMLTPIKNKTKMNTAFIICNHIDCNSRNESTVIEYF